MKHEWRKAEKSLYGTKETPIFLEVKEQRFITIKGQGNPNDEDFSNRVSALYALAYAIKMRYKQEQKGKNVSEMTDFTVYPLEGLWWQPDDAKKGQLDKEKLSYTIMIRQPDVVTEELINQALEHVRKKKPNPLYEAISFEKLTDGKCIQVLHKGSYDDEPESFSKMDAFAVSQGLKRSSVHHREIYLTNALRTKESKQKTILRYQVEEI